MKIVRFFLALMSILCLSHAAPQRAFADTFLSADFEIDPALSGWTTTGSGAGWTTANAHSGTHSLFAQTSNWYSGGIVTVPLQWYQLTFWSKAPGTVNNPGSIGYGFYAVEYYDKIGALWQSDQYESIYQSNGWVRNDMRIRAKAAPGPNGTLLPLTMKISFHPIGNQPLYIDDVTLQSTAPAEVAQWADSLYAGEPKLTYAPKGDRWAHIPLTMQKLRSAKKLRIVMLGDSVQCDSGNSPIDVFLAREYPGSSVELIVSTSHGTGVDFFTDKVAAYVTDYAPDLLIIGGISNPDPSTSAAWQSVIDQVHAYDAANGHTTEIMVVTRNWSPNNINGGGYWLSSDMTELDQYLALNASIPDNYQGHLLNFAAAHGLEFFDMTGVGSQFIYGPANEAGLGPPDENGNPYSYWMRDYIHSNTNAKQIAGRIFEKFFQPVTIPVAPTLFKPVPGTDQAALSWTASAGAASYDVKRGTVSGGHYTTISPAGGVTGTTFTDTNMASGTTYYYVVSAQNANGGSANSNQVSATLQSQPDVIVASISWTPANPATGQAAKFSAVVKNQGTGATPAGTILGVSWWIDGTQVNWEDTDTASLAAGANRTETATGGPAATNTWTATAGTHTIMAFVDDINRFEESNENNNQTSTSINVVPVAPAGLTAKGGNAQVSLSWTAAGGATSYNIYRGTAAGGESATSIAKGITATSFSNTGLTNGVTYYYKVAAVNSGGASALSNEAKAVPSAGVIAAPRSVTVSPASVYGGGTVTVSVTLTAFAPSGGVAVSLSSSDGKMIPAGTSITIPPGVARATLVVHTPPSSATFSVKLIASAAKVAVTTILTVKSPDLTALVVAPLTVSSGQNVTVRATLGSVAPPAGISVPFTSDSPVLKGASVFVAGGKSSGWLSVKTAGVSAKTIVTLVAMRNGLSKTATFTEVPPALMAFTMSAASISGGTTMTGKLTLSGPVGPSGLVIALTCSAPSVTVPAQVVVKPWTTSATFSVAPHAVNTRATAKISATLEGITKTVDVIVLPHASPAASTGSVYGGGMKI